ncbi:MAG: phosphoribosyl-ATP diphosphatase [Alphaproteobacteria bacterium]
MAKKLDAHVLDVLSETIESRRGGNPDKSYTAKLLSRGTRQVAKKFAEEAGEVVIDAVAQDKSGLVGESADVLYHLLVLWADARIKPTQVWAELARREGISGIAEKLARTARKPRKARAKARKKPRKR